MSECVPSLSLVHSALRAEWVSHCRVSVEAVLRLLCSVFQHFIPEEPREERTQAHYCQVIFSQSAVVILFSPAHPINYANMLRACLKLLLLVALSSAFQVRISQHEALAFALVGHTDVLLEVPTLPSAPGMLTQAGRLLTREWAHTGRTRLGSDVAQRQMRSERSAIRRDRDWHAAAAQIQKMAALAFA